MGSAANERSLRRKRPRSPTVLPYSPLRILRKSVLSMVRTSARVVGMTMEAPRGWSFSRANSPNESPRWSVATHTHPGPFGARFGAPAPFQTRTSAFPCRIT